MTRMPTQDEELKITVRMVEKSTLSKTDNEEGMQCDACGRDGRIVVYYLEIELGYGQADLTLCSNCMKEAVQEEER